MFFLLNWVNIFKSETEWDKQRNGLYKEAHLLQSTPFLSDRIELTSLSSLLRSSHLFAAPPSLPWLAGLIYLMEGILRRALALVVSLYCNLFPPPDVLLSKHCSDHPQIPRQTYQVVAACLCGHWSTQVTPTVTRVLGVRQRPRRGRKERSRQRDGDVRHMLTPADDTRMTWRSKGRQGAHRGWLLSQMLEWVILWVQQISWDLSACTDLS